MGVRRVAKAERECDNVPQGTLDRLVLRILESGRQHGHGIVLTIERESGAVLQVDHGSLYPACSGWQRAVVGSWSRRRSAGSGCLVQYRRFSDRRMRDEILELPFGA